MSLPSESQSPFRPLQLGMPSFVPLAVFVAALLACLGAAALLGLFDERVGWAAAVAGVVASALLATAVKVANQWERAIVLRLGQFRGTRGPGLFVVVPVVDRVRLVDTRVVTQDIRRQEVITKDNVPVAINGVLFFRVTDVE